MKKLFSFAIATALIMQSTFSVKAASVFVDIDTVPWAGAATSIEQAYNYGLLSGYVVDGKRYAKPNSNLAYSEATQLAYSIMKVYTGEEVNDTVLVKWAQIMKAYAIPTWLHPAASYCLEEGFLDPIHLGKLKDDTYKVTREEVAVLFGKALASVYGVGTNVNLPYKDSNLIQQNSFPYLALLFEKEIMVGDTDGNFRPLDKINRAEVAVFTVQAFESIYQAQLEMTTPVNGVISGTITALEKLSTGDTLLVITDSTGQSKNVTVNSTNTKITYKDESTSITQIGLNDIVTAYYTGSEATSINITESNLGIEHKAVYNLSSIDESKMTVYDSDGNRFTYTVDSDVLVYLDDNKSSVGSLALAIFDNDYTVTLTIESNNVVTRIEAVESSANPLSGELYYLSDAKAILQIGTKKYEYTVDSNVSVTYNGEDYSFSAIKSEYSVANANVTFTLNSKGYISSIKINYMDDPTNGVLDYMNSRSLKLLSRGEYYSYMINSNAKVTIDGTICEIEDIVSSYKNNPYYISIVLNSDNDIVILNAVTKNIGNSAGTLTALSDTKVSILNDGVTYQYTIANSSYTDVDIDGKTASFTTLMSEFKNYDMNVQLAFDYDGEVTKISGENLTPYYGKLKNVEPKSNKVVVTAVGIDYTYTVEEDVYIEVNDVVYDGMDDLDDAFEEASWANKSIYVELDVSSGGYVESIYVTISSSGSVSDNSIDDEDIDDIVIGEYYGRSSKDILVTVNGKTTSYDLTLSKLEGYLSYNNKSVDLDAFEAILDDYSVNEEYILSVSLYLDEDDNILYIKADDTKYKATKGNMIGIDESKDYIEMDGNHTDGIHTIWEVASNCLVYFDLNRYYDENDYTNDFDGLADLYDDALYYDDDLYLKVEVNSKGQVIVIDAIID